MKLNRFLEDLPEEPAFVFYQKKIRNQAGKVIKIRNIGNPNEAMRVLHGRLIEYLRTLGDLPYATGSRKGWSPLQNVEVHRRQRFFYLLDLKDFYPSVCVEQIIKALSMLDPDLMGYEAELLGFLESYCVSESSLITGAPASSDLANLVMGILIDRELGERCSRYGLKYTRYLDDLTFSSARHPIGEKKRKALRNVILCQGFQINHQKARVHDLRKGPIIITGVGLRYGGGTFLPRHYLRKIKGLIHLGLKEEISLSRVAGAMSYFHATTDVYGREHLLTEQDWKVLNGFRELRKKVKQ